MTGRHRHHSPAAARSSLTAAVSKISAPGGTGPPGQCREAARSPRPGQGGASSHLEEPGEPLLGTFPPAPGSAGHSLGCAPKGRTRAGPSSRRLRAAGGRAGIAREHREELRMDTFQSAQSPAGRSDAPKPPSWLGPWPQGPYVSGSKDGRSGRQGGQGEEVPGGRGGAWGQAGTSPVR